MKSPKVRFRGYTDDWEERKLSELTTMHARIGWQNLRTSEFLNSGDYMLITGTDFEDGAINYATCHYVKKERYEQDKHIQIHNGSILITKDGTLGKVAYVQGLTIPATLNAGVFNIEIKNKNEVDEKYLFQYLKAPFLMEYVSQKATGGTIKHLNQSILVDFPITMPSKIEQVKIGEYFRDIDKLITLHQRKCDEIKTLKKYMLQKMFPQNGMNVPEIRFDGFTDTWKQKKLKEIVNVCSGKDYKHLEDGDIPVYGTGGYMLSVSEALSKDKDAIGIGRKGTIDKPYILKAPFWTVDTLFYCIPNNEYDLDFSYDIFQNINWKLMDESTGVPSLSKTTINNVDILVPSYEEQKKIGKYFLNLDHLITLHQQKCDELQNIKKFMLQNMFV